MCGHPFTGLLAALLVEARHWTRLRWDFDERSDQAAFRPELVAAFEREVTEIRRRFEQEGKPPAPAPPPAAVEALRQMGYIE